MALFRRNAGQTCNNEYYVFVIIHIPFLSLFFHLYFDEFTLKMPAVECVHGNGRMFLQLIMALKNPSPHRNVIRLETKRERIFLLLPVALHQCHSASGFVITNDHFFFHSIFF